MSGKIAVITGASSGIGLLTSVELARRGHTVVATMRDPARRTRLEEVAAAAGVAAADGFHAGHEGGGDRPHAGKHHSQLAAGLGDLARHPRFGAPFGVRSSCSHE